MGDVLVTLGFIVLGVVIVLVEPYVYISPWSWWRLVWSERHADGWFGIFGNARCGRGPPTWKGGGRWGVWILGFEIGSRDPRDPVGCWLKDHGLWPW